MEMILKGFQQQVRENSAPFTNGVEIKSLLDEHLSLQRGLS